MLSMCGFICRFVRGWRQSEAASIMVHAASLEDEAIVTEAVLQSDNGGSFFPCQPMCRNPDYVRQMLWRDNNKQSSLVSPKKILFLSQWKDFAFWEKTDDIAQNFPEPNSITVLFEASYSSPLLQHDCDDTIMVSELSKPYAWKLHDSFGILVVTTPIQLVTMIEAFFNDKLLLDGCLHVYKISTVKTCEKPVSTSHIDPKPYPYTAKVPWEKAKAVLSNITSQRNYSRDMTNESCPASPLFEEEETGFSGDPPHYKPPNVLVYTNNNSEYFEDVKQTLHDTVNLEKYVIYHLTNEMAMTAPWTSNTSLLVICGDVPTHISTFFVRYLLEGGRVFSVCSDFLNVAVPLLGTSEVQEASVISMSYGSWKSVQLLHHQHCVHSSPKHQRLNFDLSKLQEQAGSSAVSVEPTSIEITDEFGIQHRIDMEILSTDDTWGSPTLLLASVDGEIGKAVFSQVHLEKNPQHGISEHLKSFHLAQSNLNRIQILKDLFEKHLHIDTKSESKVIKFTPGYLLGSPGRKNKLVTNLKKHTSNGLVKRSKTSLRFSLKNSNYVAAADFTPIIQDECPLHFSTVKYFETLLTERIGRLVIYSDVLTSGMNIVNGHTPLEDGTAVLCRRQTQGKGRSGNAWISPDGSVPICLQIHVCQKSILAQRLPFLQHLVGIAVCQSIVDEHSFIPLRLKWPNDIYLGDQSKIGGILVEASSGTRSAIVNIGVGINLNNSSPTACINDQIRKFNKANQAKVKTIEMEEFVANFFNHLEKIIEKFQAGGPEAVYDDYYTFWLHSNCHITIQNDVKQAETALIVGVDEFGFLKARLNSGEVKSLHPDGNSFDMLQGLVYTRHG